MWARAIKNLFAFLFFFWFYIKLFHLSPPFFLLFPDKIMSSLSGCLFSWKRNLDDFCSAAAKKPAKKRSYFAVCFFSKAKGHKMRRIESERVKTMNNNANKGLEPTSSDKCTFGKSSSYRFPSIFAFHRDFFIARKKELILLVSLKTRNIRVG